MNLEVSACSSPPEWASNPKMVVRAGWVGSFSRRVHSHEVRLLRYPFRCTPYIEPGAWTKGKDGFGFPDKSFQTDWSLLEAGFRFVVRKAWLIHVCKFTNYIVPRKDFTFQYYEVHTDSYQRTSGIWQYDLDCCTLRLRRKVSKPSMIEWHDFCVVVFFRA